jgi:hypothetical protein
MGGDTRPELQSIIFESGYQAGSTIYKQVFMQCVEATHKTYMLHAHFRYGGYIGTELQNALRAHARMGCIFEVTNVAVASPFLGSYSNRRCTILLSSQFDTKLFRNSTDTRRSG